MTGRLSEEHAKSAFSSALKAIIEQELELELDHSSTLDDSYNHRRSLENKSSGNNGVGSNPVAALETSSTTSPALSSFQALAESLIAVR